MPKCPAGDLNTITRTGEGISGAFALDSDAATVFEPTPGWFCIWCGTLHLLGCASFEFGGPSRFLAGFVCSPQKLMDGVT